jgi:hypothetical protein
MNREASIVSIDAGRYVHLLEEIQREAGIQPGMPLQVSCHDGRIEIEPTPCEVRIVQKGSLRVAVPIEHGPPLTQEIIRKTLEMVRSGSI